MPWCGRAIRHAPCQPRGHQFGRRAIELPAMFEGGDPRADDPRLLETVQLCKIVFLLVDALAALRGSGATTRRVGATFDLPSSRLRSQLGEVATKAVAQGDLRRIAEIPFRIAVLEAERPRNCSLPAPQMYARLW
jgi:hypothetical protein